MERRSCLQVWVKKTLTKTLNARRNQFQKMFRINLDINIRENTWIGPGKEGDLNFLSRLLYYYKILQISKNFILKSCDPLLITYELKYHYRRKLELKSFFKERESLKKTFFFYMKRSASLFWNLATPQRVPT